MTLDLTWPYGPRLAFSLAMVFLTGAAPGQDRGGKQETKLEPLPGTVALTWQGDIASRLVDSASDFLIREIDHARERRGEFWNRVVSSTQAYRESVASNRAHFSRIAGVRDERLEPRLERLQIVAEADGVTVTAVRWAVFTQVHGEGLLLEPKRNEPVADAIVLPDAGQTPEQVCGLADGIARERQHARLLAESGVRVLVPVLINREHTHRKLSNREFLYRSAFELGRHLIGHEVQKVLAGVDWLIATRSSEENRLVGVSGYSEGGLLALYSGAIDERIDVTAVSGYFGPRESVWQEPADRNVFGLLEQFGDAEISSLIAPRSLVIEAVAGEEVVVQPGTGGKPGIIRGPATEATLTELERAQRLVAGLDQSELIRGGLADFARLLGVDLVVDSGASPPVFKMVGTVDASVRHARQMEELDRHNQWLLRESAYVRQEEFWSKLDTSSVEAYKKSVEPFREQFARDVIGRFDHPLAAPAPRTRKLMESDTVTYYEVVLDVYDDPAFFLYGILLVPKDVAPGEALPCVVCQHGLEGRPQDVIGEKGFHAYQAFATKLAEQGFVTFAPQHLYIFEDRFRELQFKANTIGKTLFSLMVPQHQQLVQWLGAQPFVDAERIGFYGLSYGGKSAMRIPPLVPEYKLSICSADFNEWVWKNASTRSAYSYVWTGEYEIFEFDLGSTFNYAEMAALIAPRPFMVERGHYDGVAPDETVAYEFAKVRRLYNARLKLPDRARIEWFDGPHRINGKGTFDFIREYLSPDQ